MMIPQKRQEVEAWVRARAGQRLAGERELAAQFGISRPQLRSILDVLEREGAVQRRQGSGTYALAAGAGDLRRVVVLLDAGLKLGDDPFVSRLVERLQSELQLAGAQCLIQRAPGEDAPARGCDGVLAVGASGLKSLGAGDLGAGALGASALGASDSGAEAVGAMPAVGLFAPSTARPRARVSLLELEDEDAGRKAARRLLEKRVERVYFCGRRDLSVVKERLRGVESELSGQVPLEVLECGLNYVAGLHLGAALDAAKARVGVIAANDWLALGIHTGLQSVGLEARRNVSLVSFDGLPLTSQPELGIASLAVPLEAMAQDAVAELKRLKRPGAVGRAIRYGLEWGTG